MRFFASCGRSGTRKCDATLAHIHTMQRCIITPATHDAQSTFKIHFAWLRHMHFTAQLGRTLITSLSVLGLLCALTYFAMFIYGLVAQWPDVDWLASFLLPVLIPLYAVMIGGPAVVAFAAPIHAALLHFGRASWITAVLLGVLPGAALIALEKTVGLFGILFGLIVALTTHWKTRQINLSQ